MKHSLLYIFLIALLVASCSGGKKSFVISGKFRGLDKSEFICYSASPAWGTLDTIKVEGGSFRLEHPLSDTIILVLQYPNFMRTEVIAYPGGNVSLKGDANNMLNIRISGDEHNKDLTRFRRSIRNLKDADIPKAAAAFVEENPTSWASIAVLDRYFLQARQPDYTTISRLLSLMLKQRPDRRLLRAWQTQLQPMLKYTAGAKLPAFSLKDIHGRTVNNATFAGRPLLITFWASFSQENFDLLRSQKALLRSLSAPVSTLNISLDADSSACRNVIERDSIQGYNVCDCLCFNSPLVLRLGVRQLPANVLVDTKGVIRGRDLDAEDLKAALARMGVR